jgi:hypothetical protein
VDHVEHGTMLITILDTGDKMTLFTGYFGRDVYGDSEIALP